MASSVTVEAHRRRFTVRAGPMTPLSAVVADVLGQLKLAGEVAPEACRLSLKGKPVELSMPLRFANIGRSDKLELTTGREPVLGVQSAQQAAAPPAPPAAPATVPAAAQPAAPAPLADAAAPQAQPPQDQQAQQQAVGLPTSSPPAAPAAPVAVQPAPAAVAGPSAASAPSSSSAPAASASPSTAPAADAADSHPSVAVFGRRVYVFTRAAEQAADGGASAGGGEEDDAFFDFTEADLRRAMASQAAQRARQEGSHLMTAAMRAKEEARRAEAFGAVPIRLYLPDGAHCLQTALPASAPLSAVLVLARAALVPQAAPGAYLFTTPPRTVLKDLSLSLYAAKMVPAAKLHVGLDAGKAPGSDASGAAAGVVRPEVLALVEAPPRRAAVMHAGKPAAAAQEEAPGGSSGGGGAGAGAGAGAAARPAATGGKGVPKWLKLGK